MMTDEQVERIAVAVAEKMDDRHGACEFCTTDERRINHRQEHEFIKSLMKAADRFENIRRELLKDLMKWVGRVFIIAVLIGLIAMVAKSSGLKP